MGFVNLQSFVETDNLHDPLIDESSDDLATVLKSNEKFCTQENENNTVRVC